MKNKIVAIVVTYNRKNLLLECVDALNKQENVSCDIIIVDNNSTDGTQSAIKDLNIENINYFNTGENLGGAGGFNFGMRKAVELGYEYAWLMDDDCIPSKTALLELKKANEKYKNLGFLSSKVIWKDNTICVMNVQRQTMYKNINYNNDIDTKILMASFVSCFIPVKIILEVGLPIKDFFVWTDDWEYTRRITKKYNAFYIPKSIVIHKTEFNIGANIVNTKKDRINRFFYLYRNEVYLYRREFIVGWLYIFIRVFYHLAKIIFMAKDNKLKRIYQLFKGTLIGLFFYPKIENFEKKH